MEADELRVRLKELQLKLATSEASKNAIASTELEALEDEKSELKIELGELKIILEGMKVSRMDFAAEPPSSK